MSTDKDVSVNIDAKNMILLSLESPALRLSNRSLIILLELIFMMLLSFEYCISIKLIHDIQTIITS